MSNESDVGKGAVLVTGGSGFVGSAVIRALLDEGRQVIATTTGQVEDQKEGVEWIRWDATTGELPEVDFSRLDAVVHLAVPRALFDFPASADSIYSVVVDGTFRLLEAARKASVRRFVLASTGDVLGSRAEGGFESDRSYDPSSFYGAAKAAAEMLALSYRDLLQVAVLRLYHPYGSGGEKFLINRLVRRILLGQEVTIEGEQGIRLNPVWIDDCARGIRQAISASAAGTFHLAGPDLATLRELLELAGELSGNRPKLRSLPVQPVECHAGDDSRAREILGYFPEISLREGLLRVIEATRKELEQSA